MKVTRLNQRKVHNNEGASGRIYTALNVLLITKIMDSKMSPLHFH
jgi:hypothetical protein